MGAMIDADDDTVRAEVVHNDTLVRNGSLYCTVDGLLWPCPDAVQDQPVVPMAPMTAETAPETPEPAVEAPADPAVPEEPEAPAEEPDEAAPEPS